MHRYHRYLLSILLCFVSLAFSDTGWYPPDLGSPVYSGQLNELGWTLSKDYAQHPTIRMVEENVDIYLHKKEATVFCEFLFKNDGDATNVGMFYPLTSFKSAIVADFEVYKKDKNGQLITILYNVKKLEEDGLGVVALWDMNFNANDEERVVCKYSAFYGSSYEYEHIPRWQMEKHDIWEIPGLISEFGQEYSGLHPRFCAYILSTGATWMGSIGKGRIAFHTTDEVCWEDLIDYEGVFYANRFKDWYIDPNKMNLLDNNKIKFKIEGDALIIEFENLEPYFGDEEKGLKWLEELLITFYYENLSIDNISASSNLSSDKSGSYNVLNLGNQLTGFSVWAEGAKGDGVGEWIKGRLLPSEPVEHYKLPITIKGMHLYGGYHSNENDFSTELFDKNGAPSGVTIDLFKNTKKVFTKSFDLEKIRENSPDSQNIGNVYLDFGMPVECDEFKLMIDRVRSGSKYQDTCLSGIVPIVYDPRTHHKASSVFIETINDIARYHPIKIDDGRKDTCWAEGSPGNGIGEWIEFSWEKPRDISGFTIIPGFAKDENVWNANSRPKTVELVFYNGDGEILREEFNIDDSMKTQKFFLKNGTIKNVKKVVLNIKAVYTGTKYNDLCISELNFL